MKVCWDTKKNRLNKRNHGVDFETAQCVFDDPNLVEFYDERHSSNNEDRYNVIGFVDILLFVVYTERTTINGEDVIRLISARKANSMEEKQYASNLH